MIQAYNHFSSEYSSLLSARSASHKPGELKSICSRIRTQNQHSAFYRLDLSEDKQKFALSLKNNALALGVSLRELKESSLHPTLTHNAVSSQPDAVSVELISGAGEDFAEPIHLSVDTLAAAQQNTGRFVPSDSEGPTPDTYHFTIHSDGEDYEFTYQVTTAPTNRGLMEKLSDFINQSDIGIHAALEEKPEDGLSRLVLTAQTTGTSEGETLAFSIRDNPAFASADHPGLVSYFGLAHTETQPSNASFSLDGVQKTSMRNTFTLGHTLSVTLQQTTAKEVTISPSATVEHSAEKVQTVLDCYNRLVKLSQQGLPGNRLSSRLFHVLSRLPEVSAAQLSQAGLSRMPDGTLLIPEEFDASALSDPTLFEEPEGVFFQLAQRAAAITIDPMEFLDKTLITYPNLSRSGIANPYVTSFYSGMLFNSYC